MGRINYVFTKDSRQAFDTQQKLNSLQQSEAIKYCFHSSEIFFIQFQRICQLGLKLGTSVED